MAARIPVGLTVAPYSRAKGRRFGLVVGTAFLLIAGALAWRGAAVGALIPAAPGAVLVLGAVCFPRRLERFETLWMRLAHAISRVTTPIVLGVIFFLVITPIGLVMRLVGHRPLRRPDGQSFWVPRPLSSSDMRRQF
jgi:hypothetical protein